MNKNKKRKQTRPSHHTRSRKSSHAPHGHSRRAHPGSSNTKILTGSFTLHAKGFGFVRPDSAKLPDIFIPAHATCGALTLDYVEIQAHFYDKGKSSGAIRRILKRRSQQLVGRAFKDNGQWFLCEKKSSRLFALALPPRAKINSDAIIIAERVSRKSGEAAVYQKTIDSTNFNDCQEALLAEFGLGSHFPTEVACHADAIPFGTHANDRDAFGLAVKDRVDLRQKAFVTIDGADAKDFDDAVYAEKTKDGGLRLWVSIADVSAFVAEGSACDREAYERGTSTYFPGYALPMLPERLSNHLCSLVPHKERWTFTAEIHLDANGTPTQSTLYPSIICSKARLTYTQVQEFLDGRSSQTLSDSVSKSLLLLRDIAERLMHQRHARGSLDFDLPEAVFVLAPDRSVKDVVNAPRLFAHRLIEECMIAANEAVGRFMEAHKLPGLWRIHESPDADNLEHFLTSLKLYNQALHVPSRAEPPRHARCPRDKQASEDLSYISPKLLQSWIDEFKGQRSEPFLMKLLLRSLKQAHYLEENLGHFGLASKSYSHFTSPIRRYPDLYIHRLLRKSLLNANRASSSKEFSAKVASFSSYRERISMEAEREMNKLFSTQFMQDKVGREFDGIVSHTTPYGFYVVLKDHFVEGFLPRESLGLDAQYDDKALAWTIAKSGTRYELGQSVKVQVIKASLYDRATELRLCSN